MWNSYQFIPTPGSSSSDLQKYDRCTHKGKKKKKFYDSSKLEFWIYKKINCELYNSVVIQNQKEFYI
ncbi:unnamed protein product [Paramecium pentaurelia]|uniref:Uncharacterized protein n=1 Tax=Paramecium pentaurelia TaxID=43138 RepID=A0A8S1Y014_9CILI|nr:unnamed protein product [Paramecium pentaurelia]